MNFALILFIAIIISGLICLFDIFWLRAKRRQGATPHWLIREARSFFPILIIVLILRSFLIEPFRIPSSSLEPTLQIGDFVAVNKFIYGIRLPIIEKKMIAIQDPKRGDIIVFRWPPNPKFDYIKRVIGLPGDHIKYENKQLSINGKPVKLSPTALSFKSNDPNVQEFIEDLPGVKHHIYQRKNVEPFDFDIRVPKNHYFVMGDNRDDSADSRYWGFVPDAYLRGKAFGIWMSWNAKTWRIRFNRIGRAIH
jgi:signal peptidase I